MRKDDFLKVIDEEITPHVDTHKTMIIISGGEPLMRNDLEEVGRELYNREYPWGIVTNGIAMTPARFERLLAAGLRSMSVSLDGLEADHLWLRQHPLAYEGAVRTIQLCGAHQPLTYDVITCVTPRIINKLSQIEELLVSLQVPAWRLVSIEPMGRAATNPELLLSSAQLKQLLDFIDGGHRINVSYGCSGFLGDYEGRVRDHLHHCAAGISVASILIDGSISACTSIRGKYYQGNIYKDSFWDVWEHRFEPYRHRAWMRKKEPCRDCKVWRYCEGDGMHLRSEEGDLLRCHYNQLLEVG